MKLAIVDDESCQKEHTKWRKKREILKSLP